MSAQQTHSFSSHNSASENVWLTLSTKLGLCQLFENTRLVQGYAKGLF